jgi:hypothetical protein
MYGDLEMDLKKEELLNHFLNEIKKQLESKSDIGFIPEEELTYLTKEVLSLLAKVATKRFTEY